MPNTTSVLLPSLFPTDSVHLGQLLPNPLIPTLNPFISLETPCNESDTLSSKPIRPYMTQVSLSRSGRFNIGLTHLLGGQIGAQSTSYLSIEAESMEYKCLRNSDEMFRRICEDSKARLWIQEMATHRKPFYLVVGLQKLSTAKVKSITLKEKDGEGKVTVPTEMTATLPLYIGGKLSAQGFGMSSGTMDGVFGIEARRVNTTIKTKDQHMLQRQQQKSQQQSMVPGLLTDKIRWHFSYERKKSGAVSDTEREMEVGLYPVAELDELTALLEAHEVLSSQDPDDDEMTD